MRFNKQCLFFLCVFLLGGCAVKRLIINDILKSQSPYDSYRSALEKSNISSTALGKDWIERGQSAFNDSLAVILPYRETVYFPVDKIRVYSYIFKARKGEVIRIKTNVTSRVPLQVFTDLFENDKKNRKLMASSENGHEITLEIKRNRIYTVRLQTELLRSCLVEITIESSPSLLFPVQGKGSKAVISTFGDSRGNGKRKHEGIDIGAPKGTPVIAASDGICRVAENELGGKVIFLTDIDKGQTLYYAHLDSQLVITGQTVTKGQIIGLIGNSGNARKTAPHLHFGIYEFWQAAVDPYPFVHINTTPLPASLSGQNLVESCMRTGSVNAALYHSPDQKSAKITWLPQYSLCKILGGTDKWYRVELPNGVQGYLTSKFLEKVEKPVRIEKIVSSTPFFDDIYEHSIAIDSLQKDYPAYIFAVFGNCLYTKNITGCYGWITSQTKTLTD